MRGAIRKCLFFNCAAMKWTFNFFIISLFRWWDWKNCYWTNLRDSVQWLTRCNCKYFCVINRVYARHSILRSLLSLSLWYPDLLLFIHTVWKVYDTMNAKSNFPTFIRGVVYCIYRGRLQNDATART